MFCATFWVPTQGGQRLMIFLILLGFTCLFDFRAAELAFL